MKTLPKNSISSRYVMFGGNSVHFHPLGAWAAPSSSSSHLLLTGRTACRQPTCERLPSPLASYLRAEQSSGDAASGAVRDRAVAVQERRRRPRRAARVLRQTMGAASGLG